MDDDSDHIVQETEICYCILSALVLLHVEVLIGHPSIYYKVFRTLR